MLIDGSDQANHPRLRKLFEISGQSPKCSKGRYPQVFREELGTPLMGPDQEDEGGRRVETAVFVGMAADVIIAMKS